MQADMGPVHVVPADSAVTGGTAAPLLNKLEARYFKSA